MRELRCALADIFTRCGTNTVKRERHITANISLNKTTDEFEMVSVIPNITYDVESGTERTLAFGIIVKDAVWMIDRLNEFGYDVISVTQDSSIWKPKDKNTNIITIYTYGSNYFYFKVRKIEQIDLMV